MCVGDAKIEYLIGIAILTIVCSIIGGTLTSKKGSKKIGGIILLACGITDFVINPLLYPAGAVITIFGLFAIFGKPPNAISSTIAYSVISFAGLSYSLVLKCV